MKVSELINELTKVLNEKGDLNVYSYNSYEECTARPNKIKIIESTEGAEEYYCKGNNWIKYDIEKEVLTNTDNIVLIEEN